MHYMEICANCKYWAWELDECPSEVGSAECKRYPPMASHVFIDDYERSGIAYSNGPVTFADDWCGEFCARRKPWDEWTEE